MASTPQPWDWLEDRRSKDDKVSIKIWKAVEIKVRRTEVAKIEEKREKGRRRRRRRKEVRRKRAEKEKKRQRS